MKTMIQYSYFEDKDADGVAALMVKNNFWMGKYNRSLDGINMLPMWLPINWDPRGLPTAVRS